MGSHTAQLGRVETRGGLQDTSNWAFDKKILNQLVQVSLDRGIFMTANLLSLL